MTYPAMVWPGYSEKQSFLDVIDSHDGGVQRICEHLNDTFTILANGDVVPCCYDLKGEVVFGNVLEESIFDIWNGEKMREFREKMFNGKVDSLCKKCIMFNKRYLVYRDRK